MACRAKKIKILDVRTPGEYIFVGHAPMATNIPIKFFKDVINLKKMKPVMPLNENFVDEVKKKFKETDTIMIMCRSGSRSAIAVNKLAKAGFKNVYNITDGFEGDKLKAPGSYNSGKRIVNGWKNSGVSWTYKLDPKLVYLP
jgi:rhodanese-related sulfurtransferase